MAKTHCQEYFHCKADERLGTDQGAWVVGYWRTIFGGPSTTNEYIYIYNIIYNNIYIYTHNITHTHIYIYIIDI